MTKTALSLLVAISFSSVACGVSARTAPPRTAIQLEEARGCVQEGDLDECPAMLARQKVYQADYNAEIAAEAARGCDFDEKLVGCPGMAEERRQYDAEIAAEEAEHYAQEAAFAAVDPLVEAADKAAYEARQKAYLAAKTVGCKGFACPREDGKMSDSEWEDREAAKAAKAEKKAAKKAAAKAAKKAASDAKKAAKAAKKLKSA